MNRGKGLTHDPARAAERKARRMARRAAEQTPQDAARELRALEQAGRAPRRSSTPDEAAARRFWQQKVTADGCAMCADLPVDGRTRSERGADLARLDPHHLIPQQDLKRWGLHDRLFDVRNGLCLCRYHHFRHEGAVQRVPRRLVPVAAFEFADEIGARFVLEDDVVYPLDS